MSEKPVSTLEPKACISCGAVLSGVFCSNCGEKQIDKESYSIKNFFYRFISEVANFDGRVYTSFKLLFSRPGLLTHEYISGKRKPYLKPVQMFLIANILYFLIQPFTIYTGFNTTLQSQVKRQYYSDIANLEEIVEKKVEQSGLSYIEYERLFNTKSSIYARSFIFILIPLFAITLAVFFRGRREYFVEHLEFSVHFFAWELFFLLSIFLFFLRVSSDRYTTFCTVFFLRRFENFKSYSFTSYSGYCHIYSQRKHYRCVCNDLPLFWHKTVL